jgi:hypothetical protein
MVAWTVARGLVLTRIAGAKLRGKCGVKDAKGSVYKAYCLTAKALMPPLHIHLADSSPGGRNK